jgi:hypothetical protein
MPVGFTRTRADMEKAIADGGSVQLPDGRIVSRVEDLPNESDLAASDDARMEAEEKRLQAVVDGHTAELKKVQDRRATLAKAAPKVAAAPPKSAAADEGDDADKARAAAHKGHK